MDVRNKRTMSGIGCPCKNIKISASTLSAALATGAILLTTICIMFIIVSFTKEASSQIAFQMSNLMVEKVTLRVKGVLDKATSVASAGQAVVYSAQQAPLPTEDSVDSWDLRWQSWGTAMDKSLGGQAYAISFVFDDGSFFGASANYQTPLERDKNKKPFEVLSALGSNVSRIPGEMPMIYIKSKIYNYTTMKFIGLNGYFIPFSFELNFNRSAVGRSAPTFSKVFITYIGLLPVIKVLYPLYNGSDILLGIGEVELRLDSFEELVKQQLPTKGSSIFILNQQRQVLASTLPNMPIMTNITVPSTYVLTPAEEEDGCLLAPYGEVTNFVDFVVIKSAQKSLLCITGFESFGYEPLRLMGEQGLIPREDEIFPSSVCNEKLGNLGRYYISIVDYNQYFPTLNWIGVILIPEDEVGSELAKGGKIAFGVSAALAFIVVIGIGLMTHYLLRPLTDIVQRMQNASYLTEDYPSQGDDDLSNSEMPPCEQKQNEEADVKVCATSRKPSARGNDRTLSYLSDVAAIQTAYWSMSDELVSLRSYIPEHIRNLLLEQREMKKKEVLPSTNNQQITFSSIEDPLADGSDAEIEVTYQGNTTTDGSTTAQRIEGLPRPAGSITFSAAGANIMADLSPLSEFGTEPGGYSNLISHELEPETIPYDPPFSLEASTRQMARFDSLRDVSDMNDFEHPSGTDPLPHFVENGLVERKIAVAVINIIGLHERVFACSPNTDSIIKDHEYLVSYVHEVAERYGGVLENFSGDKFWVTFNASTKCEDIHVTAAMFAHTVASTINSDVGRHTTVQREGMPPLVPHRQRFQIAKNGVTIGVAAGHAFVGPLGTRRIRRHSIISCALSEASSYERMATRYPDCGVMVGGDMIPALEGYFQYLLLDATAIPGSGSLRRRIASIKGPMLAPKLQLVPAFMHSPLQHGTRLPARNPFEAINDCFNAFLEGRSQEVDLKLGDIYNEISNRLDQSTQGTPRLSSLPHDRPILTNAQWDNIQLMANFISCISEDTDGRQYRSSLGSLYERSD